MPRMTNRIMKRTLKALTSICLSAVMWAAMATHVNGAEPANNINPALLYYQAFTAAPNYSSADWDYLYVNLTNSWRGQKLPDRFGEMMTNNSARFKLVRQAAQQTAPCDWGIDWSAGEDTLLPQLARAKQVAVMARFRAAWDLQNGQASEACEDLLGTLALARNCWRDSALIGVLVEIADENLICETVAENFGGFTPESLQQLEDGLSTALPRGPQAEVVSEDEARSYERLKTRVLELRKEHPADDAAVVAGISNIFFSSDGADPQRWNRIAAAAGGASDGVIKLADDLKPLYRRFSEILAMPYPAYQSEMDRFDTELKKSTNPLVEEIFSPLSKSRVKEFRSEMNLAMLHAAIEYKLRGQAGLESVPDPFGAGPFKIQRFLLNGTDRGFKLQSAITGLGVPAVFIFLEKAGTPVHLDGLHAGEPLE